MRKIVIVGGCLQGIEVTYLANAAGYETIVMDKKNTAPAFHLAKRYYVCDVTNEQEKTKNIIKEADLIFPALENKQALSVLKQYAKECNIPFLFDAKAYSISSSKILSNQLFEQLELPIPGSYPNCEYPVIVKPDNLSGSSNVKKAYSKEEVEEYQKEQEGQQIVIQEFLEGRSFSLEVLGNGRDYIFPEITEVVVDASYDCKRILSPAILSKEEEKQLYEIGEKLAKKLKIQGIFDIEVISQKGILKILEIDARFPSQTPISVFHSTGINMVELLVEQTLTGKWNKKEKQNKYCCYQQILVENGFIKVLGEHIIAQCSSVHIEKDFFGADVAITDYEQGKQEFRAIVITTGNSNEEAYHKFLYCIDSINQIVGNGTFVFEDTEMEAVV